MANNPDFDHEGFKRAQAFVDGNSNARDTENSNKPFDSQSYFDKHNNTIASTAQSPQVKNPQLAQAEADWQQAQITFRNSLTDKQKEIFDPLVQGEIHFEDERIAAESKFAESLTPEQQAGLNDYNNKFTQLDLLIRKEAFRQNQNESPAPVSDSLKAPEAAKQAGTDHPGKSALQRFEATLTQDQKIVLEAWRKTTDREEYNTLNNALMASLTPEQKALRKEVYQEYSSATQLAKAPPAPVKERGDLAIIGSGNQVMGYDPRIKQAQEMLAKLGHDTNGIDGLEGPATRRALKTFAEENKLNPETLTIAGVIEGAKTLIAQNESKAELTQQSADVDYVSKIPEKIMFGEKPGSMVMALDETGRDIIRDQYGKTPIQTFADVSTLVKPEPVLDAGLTATNNIAVNLPKIGMGSTGTA